MAYLTNTTCDQCGAEFMGDLFRGLGTCSKCVKVEEAKKKAAHFTRLDKMTLEERMRELEEIAYRRSITPPQYVPPPLIGGNG